MLERQTDPCVEFVSAFNRFNPTGVNRRSYLRYYNAALPVYVSFGSYGTPLLCPNQSNKEPNERTQTL